MTSKLPLDPKGQTENECHQKPKSEVGVTPGKRQLLSLGRDGPRACPSSRVRLSRRARRAAREGRGCSRNLEKRRGAPRRPASRPCPSLGLPRRRRG